MNPIYIVKRPSTVQFNVFNFARFANFSFIATEDGQEEFTLDVTPTAIMLLAINGTTQNGAKTPPDFTFEGQVITIPGGVDAGDYVYGVVQY
ncbi:hypothetical protein EKK58_10050 [Candidatus Dependentiae bacterium]|nr:MAG: hypothetical protein EKK58_10050 [Candidatus Dependentiae bacterium]